MSCLSASLLCQLSHKLSFWLPTKEPYQLCDAFLLTSQSEKRRQFPNLLLIFLLTWYFFTSVQPALVKRCNCTARYQSWTANEHKCSENHFIPAQSGSWAALNPPHCTEVLNDVKCTSQGPYVTKSTEVSCSAGAAVVREALSTSKPTYLYSHTPVKFMQHCGKIIVYSNCSVAMKIRVFLDVQSPFLLYCLISLGSNKLRIF